MLLFNSWIAFAEDITQSYQHMFLMRHRPPFFAVPLLENTAAAFHLIWYDALLMYSDNMRPRMSIVVVRMTQSGLSCVGICDLFISSTKPRSTPLSISDFLIRLINSFQYFNVIGCMKSTNSNQLPIQTSDA